MVYGDKNGRLLLDGAEVHSSSSSISPFIEDQRPSIHVRIACLMATNQKRKETNKEKKETRQRNKKEKKGGKRKKEKKKEKLRAITL